MKYYIDLGSNVIKIYESKEKKLSLIEEKDIFFQENFDEEEGISRKKYRELMQYMKQLIDNYKLNNENCNIYATGIWRKIPNEQFETLKADFNDKRLKFNIISKDEEKFYFEKAVQGIYDSKRILMVNIGSKQTELLVYDKANIVNRKTLNIGVTEIVNNFPTINEKSNDLKKEDIINYVLEVINKENIDFSCDCGVFTGGELRFQKLVKYNLVPNAMFNDNIHEYMISFKDFEKKNKELLNKISLQDLYLLMPNNKSWLEGSKAAAILAEAIFKKANVEYIIPSDLNIINGIAKRKSRS